MRLSPRLPGVVLALALTGCVQKPEPLYTWGAYDAAMYDYARDTATQSDFQAALSEVIRSNEAAGRRMPPGIYAEYGYQLLEQNKVEEAVGFFEKEKRTWTESTAFMTMMIAYARGGKRLNPTTTAEKMEAK